ncbi:MAG TPA: hypothetical protein VM123_16405 [archaeon]|nr:hypothetical protein [archaeon]
MALSPTQTWKDASRAGTTEPVLLFELRPTVLYDERNFRGDWNRVDPPSAIATGTGQYQNYYTLNPNHPSDELRLASWEVEHPEKQTHQVETLLFAQSVTYYSFAAYGRQTRGQSARGGFLQTFKSSRAFRLKKLYLGLRNESPDPNTLYKGRLFVTIYRNLLEIDTAGAEGNSHLGALLDSAERVFAGEIDFSSSEGCETLTDSSGFWHVLDFSDQNIWLPGGSEPCAILLEPESQVGLETLKLVTGGQSYTYPKGQLYKYDPETGRFIEKSGDLAFKFIVDGYQPTGSGIWTFDVGETPSAGLDGELELCYSEPADTSLYFQMREAAAQSGLSSKPWKTVTDGSRITKRWVQVKVTFSSGTGPNGSALDTPRVYSMRVAFKESHRFVLASRPLFGYPNCVAEAPDYSAEGEPLSGEASATDTSRIVLIDGGGMPSRIFSRCNMKNDEIKVYLGFDCPSFLDTSQSGYNNGNGDWLDFKTIWIEDWEILDGRIVVHGYDQQVRFKEAESPGPCNPPDMAEEIHYDLQNPADIKRDLLKRARIRPSKIDPQSFSRLESAFDWGLTHEIKQTTNLQKVDRELNRHLLAFQVVDETGKWATRYVDYGNTAYDPELGLWLQNSKALPWLRGDDLIAGSERFYPGRKYVRNVAVILFGGKGSDQREYRGIAIDYDENSEKAHKEYASDKILSEFIPAGEDAGNNNGIPLKVARNRLNLQKDGVRMLEFSTRLEFACLQIGDHINLTSTLYSRPGEANPNPLLGMLTRKNIDRNLDAIHWAALVLLDAGQCATQVPTVNPPQNVSVTAGGDGTVSWNWARSADDTAATGNNRYELLQRPSHLETWGSAKTRVNADGSANYEYIDPDFTELISYDFGVRYVNASGRASQIISCENVLVIDSDPGPPGEGDWSVLPLPGAVEVYLINEMSGAHHYNVYVRPDTNTGWQLVGTIPREAGRRGSFIWTPPNPYVSDSYRFSLFALSSVDNWGKESSRSAQKLMCYRPLMSPTEVLPAPGFSTGGGAYPLISRVSIESGFAFSITLKIVAPCGEEDKIDRYELERRDDCGTGQASWSGWERIPDYKVRQEDSSIPAPSAIYYDNTDRKLKPTYYYQYRVRAVGKNNVPGSWSESVTLQLTEDTTPPDQPAITVENFQYANKIKISEPALGGVTPCPDFSHFKIEGYEQSAAIWITLSEHYKGTVFMHQINDSDLGENWKYRVTAYDHSGNASTVSSESGYKSQKKAGTAALSSVVNDTLAQVSVNESNIELKVDKSGVISSINISTEGIDIQGDRITLNGDTVFSADCEVYGLLKLVKTSDNTERIEIGSFNGEEEIRLYGNDALGARLGTIEISESTLGVINLYGPDELGTGESYRWDLTAWYMIPVGASALVLPDASKSGSWFSLSGKGELGWHNTDREMKILEGSNLYRFAPVYFDTENNKLVIRKGSSTYDILRITYNAGSNRFEWAGKYWNADGSV